MPLVALLADLGLIPEALAAVCGAIAGAMAITHAWKLIRGTFSKGAA
ncbi:hypothetical protein [Dyella jiangningensis]